MERQGTQRRRDAPIETNLDLAERKTKLHMHILGLTFTHMILLGAWVWLSQLGTPSARVLLGLLILTGLNWLWLAVVAKRWRSCWKPGPGNS